MRQRRPDLHFVGEYLPWRLHAPRVPVPGVDTVITAALQPAAFVFGSGKFNGEKLHYIGRRGTAYAAGYALGGALLVGKIDPGSPVHFGLTIPLGSVANIGLSPLDDEDDEQFGLEQWIFMPIVLR